MNPVEEPFATALSAAGHLAQQSSFARWKGKRIAH